MKVQFLFYLVLLHDLVSPTWVALGPKFEHCTGTTEALKGKFVWHKLERRVKVCTNGVFESKADIMPWKVSRHQYLKVEQYDFMRCTVMTRMPVWWWDLADHTLCVCCRDTLMQNNAGAHCVRYQLLGVENLLYFIITVYEWIKC